LNSCRSNPDGEGDTSPSYRHDGGGDGWCCACIAAILLVAPMSASVSANSCTSGGDMDRSGTDIDEPEPFVDFFFLVHVLAVVI
jgi:hypothetical protein